MRSSGVGCLSAEDAGSNPANGFFCLFFFFFFLTIKKLWQFEEPFTNKTFAGTVRTYPAHTLKMNVDVFRWPFQSLNNSLFIAFDSKVSDPQGKQVGANISSQSIENASVKSITVSTGGAVLYP